MCYLYVMLLLGYVLCDVYVTEAWNTPGTKSDNAQLCYLDKIAGGQSTWVLAFKSRTKVNFSGLFLRDLNDVLSQKRNSLG